MKKKYTITTSLLLLLLMLNACDFGDTNTDPASLLEVDASNILPATLAQSARNVGSIGARVTGTVIQHFKGISSQCESYTIYALDESIIDDYWRSGLYGGAMKDCADIIEKAAETDMPYYRGIAKVIMAFNLGIATSFWGDVPYSEAFQNEEDMTPAYDTQEEVYEAIQRLLDEAITDFARDEGDLVPGDDDLIFGGDIVSWVATARALKARYYMHLTKVDEDAYIDALQVLAKGTISDTDEQPDFPFEAESTNAASPLAYFMQESPDQLILGDYLKNLMVDQDDPRLDYYGVESDDDYEIYDGDSDSDLFWARNDTPLALISYTEVKFIEAEAYLRAGNTDKAQDALEEAITSNMDRLGASSYSSYISSYATLTGTYEDDLETIMTQKYIALYGQAIIESWVDYRRTGYPALTLPEDTELNVSYFSSGSAIIPRRYLYTVSESSTNGENYQAAIDRQGGHLLDNDMWAFQDQ